MIRYKNTTGLDTYYYRILQVHVIFQDLVAQPFNGNVQLLFVKYSLHTYVLYKSKRIGGE
jgi:hypothetical protein